MAANYHINEQLDKVLQFIISHELTALTADTIQTGTNVDTKYLLEILIKLERDGYIKGELRERNFQFPIDYYLSTFDGRLFIEDGGYAEQRRRLKISTNNERIRNFLMTIGTVAAGAYGIYEILKWLFHHEGWHLFF